MDQKIVCHKGRCFETDMLKSEFDSLFDDSNLVERIQRDLWKNAFI